MDLIREILRDTFELDEEKTPLKIGYHITDDLGFKGAMASNGLRVDVKNKKFDYRQPENKGWDYKSLNGVYVTTDLAKAIRHYSSDGYKTYVFIIQYAEKTTLADPQYDILAKTSKFINEKIGNKQVLSKDFTEKISVNVLKKYNAEYKEEFAKYLHNILSQGNSQVPFKPEIIGDFLFWTMLRMFRFSIEERLDWDSAMDEWHSNAEKIINAYKGFKKIESDSLIIPHNVGFSGRTKIIGVLYTNHRKEDFNWETRLHRRDSYSSEVDTKEKSINGVDWFVTYGDKEQLKKVTGLRKIFSDEQDRREFEWAEYKKKADAEKLEKQRLAKERRREQDKLRRLNQKQAASTQASTAALPATDRPLI